MEQVTNGLPKGFPEAVARSIAKGVTSRIRQLGRGRLGDTDRLDGAFGAGDMMMVSMLFRLKSSVILDEYPNLAVYVARGEARAAYTRAFDAQLAVYAGKPPTG